MKNESLYIRFIFVEKQCNLICLILLRHSSDSNCIDSLVFFKQINISGNSKYDKTPSLKLINYDVQIARKHPFLSYDKYLRRF